MTKTPHTTDSAETEPKPQDVVEAAPDAAEQTAVKAPPAVDFTHLPPAERGFASLAPLDPLRLWTVKAPKEIGGTISGVFLQAESRVVLLQQLESGRFVIFGQEKR